MALLTATEALSKLNQYNSIEAIKVLIGQVTGEVLGASEDESRTNGVRVIDLREVQG